MRASIEKLSAQIQNQPHLEAGEKQELLSLLSEIEAEASEAAAEEITLAMDMVHMTGESVEAQSIPEQLEESLLKLEATYPRTSAALGRIAHVLSRMGI